MVHAHYREFETTTKKIETPNLIKASRGLNKDNKYFVLLIMKIAQGHYRNYYFHSHSTRANTLITAYKAFHLPEKVDRIVAHFSPVE